METVTIASIVYIATLVSLLAMQASTTVMRTDIVLGSLCSWRLVDVFSHRYSDGLAEFLQCASSVSQSP